MPNIFAILLQLCFFVQCTLQLLYTFYECQNHIKILTREILYKETSRYVEQVKISEKRGLVSTPVKIPNKRNLNYKTLKTISIQPVSKDSEGDMIQDFVLRDMSRRRSTTVKLSAIEILIRKDMQDGERDRQRNTNNFSFFVLMTFSIIVASVPYGKIPEYIANIAGSTTVPFLQFLLPGSLYFYFLRKSGVTQADEKYNRWNFLVRFIFGRTFSFIFAMLGLMQIFVYTAIIIYGFFI